MVMPSPVPNPSREIEKLWTRTWGTSLVRYRAWTVDAEGRLRVVAEAARLTIDAPSRLPSDSNEVWKIGDLVLRICPWSTDPTRLQREGLILEHLPDDVPHV